MRIVCAASEMFCFTVEKFLRGYELYPREKVDILVMGVERDTSRALPPVLDSGTRLLVFVEPYTDRRRRDKLVGSLVSKYQPGELMFVTHTSSDLRDLTALSLKGYRILFIPLYVLLANPVRSLIVDKASIVTTLNDCELLDRLGRSFVKMGAYERIVQIGEKPCNSPYVSTVYTVDISAFIDAFMTAIVEEKDSLNYLLASVFYANSKPIIICGNMEDIKYTDQRSGLVERLKECSDNLILHALVSMWRRIEQLRKFSAIPLEKPGPGLISELRAFLNRE